jgi:pantothenate kinase
MDGYHLSRAQLSALPNAAEAHARRGAEFTFDGASFLSLVRAVRAQRPDSPTLYAPSFDHALKDPKADDIPILALTKVVLFEGNYLSLDRGPWKEAAALMDELWFVDVAFETAKRRLVERHVRTGVTSNREEAAKRADENDLPNGEEIIRYRIKGVHEIIISSEDDSWKTEVQGG